jgi:tRNA threonylcarbamoyladenosine biosynthesis protein TsaE
MQSIIFHTKSAQETQACGRGLADFLGAGDVVLLAGDLGAGKTQLTKGIAHGLGVAEPVTSPTFNILLVYEGRLPLYHIDLYRLEEAGQLEDIDYFGTLEGDGVAIVEWGDRFVEAQPADGLSVVLRIEGDEERAIEVSALGPRGSELAEAWGRACGQVGAASGRTARGAEGGGDA